MHIADGLMAPIVWIIGWGLAMVFIGIAVIKVNKTLDEKAIPFMAILAAGIFVAQMLNFPIIGGTTGHLIGAALATVLLGPWAALLILTVILIIQCLIFGDGGITALGLNILNMAVIGSLSAWVVLRAFRKMNETGAVFAAAWVSVFFASTACAIQLALSYSIDPAFGIEWVIAIPAMMISHTFIGIGEAIITTGVFVFLAKVAPETLKMQADQVKEVPS